MTDPLQLDWEKLFPPDRFALQSFAHEQPLLQYIHQHHESIDCLLLLSPADGLREMESVAHRLCEWGLLLPTVLVLISIDPLSPEQYHRIQSLQDHNRFFYHNATIVKLIAPDILIEQLRGQIPHHPPLNLAAQVDRAIALFLQLSPTCGLPEGEEQGLGKIPGRVRHQQQRLAEKLRDRLGYAGVYYHRDPERFYRRLPSEEQQRIMQRLRGLYQAIVLDYFQSPAKANVRIDELVALAFFGDMGASQLLELHMSLMDDFARQLKLEGRSEEVLLDYRITLIDVIAHLSEMYRRSIPRES